MDGERRPGANVRRLAANDASTPARDGVRHINPQQLFMSSVYLMVLGLLLGYMSENEKKLRAERVVITRCSAPRITDRPASLMPVMKPARDVAILILTRLKCSTSPAHSRFSLSLDAKNKRRH